MKVLKKVLAVLSASAMLIGSGALSMTASADPSIVNPDVLVALYDWTNYLEENGVPFTMLGTSGNDAKELVRMCKEKGISLSEMFDYFEYGSKILDLLKRYLNKDYEVSFDLACYMLGAQGGLNSNMACGPRYGRSPEEDERCKEMEAKGYIWNGERWDFDVEGYMMENGLCESEIYSYTSNVSSNVVLSGDTFSCRSKVTGNKKTTKIIVTQYLERLSKTRWETIKVWKKTEKAGDMIMTSHIKAKTGLFRLRSVFKVYSGKNFETITRYSPMLCNNGLISKVRELIPGEIYDFSGDGIFGMSDVETLQKALLTGTTTAEMDINGDGKVNVFDLVAVKRMLCVDQ